jgi:hypothetical protein
MVNDHGEFSWSNNLVSLTSENDELEKKRKKTKDSKYLFIVPSYKRQIQ